MLAKDVFLTLVRLGIETEDASCTNTQSFCELSQKDWECIRDMSEKQGVSAIVMDGLSRMVNIYGKDGIAPKINQDWWQQYVFEGMGAMLQIEQANRLQTEVMNDLAEQWVNHGCKVMVFKGQACATMYPKPEHRNPGDIDCYLFDDYTRGNDIARKAGAEVDEGWYKHSQIHYKGEMFENHQFFVHTRDGKRGKMLQKEMEEGLRAQSSAFGSLSSKVLLPPVQWTAMFLTYHACSHFVSEGLRMKQILDWAMLLEKHQNDVDWEQFYAYCERNHLRRFADAATAICVKHLGVKVVRPEIVTESPYAEKILDSALYDDDYVFGSGEGSWHNRWHLVRNLFRYRWKYEDIYEKSAWRQLWYYASGYLFHTE